MSKKYVRGVATLVFGTALVALASTPAAAQCGDVPAQFEDIAALLTRVQELGVALGLLIAVVMFIWVGISWMRGTPDSQQRAKRRFWNVSIGVVIILMASGFVEFVKSVLGCGGF